MVLPQLIRLALAALPLARIPSSVIQALILVWQQRLLHALQLAALPQLIRLAHAALLLASIRSSVIRALIVV
jgi:hypothetical protein